MPILTASLISTSFKQVLPLTWLAMLISNLASQFFSLTLFPSIFQAITRVTLKKKIHHVTNLLGAIQWFLITLRIKFLPWLKTLLLVLGYFTDCYSWPLPHSCCFSHTGHFMVSWAHQLVCTSAACCSIVWNTVPLHCHMVRPLTSLPLQNSHLTELARISTSSSHYPSTCNHSLSEICVNIHIYMLMHYMNYILYFLNIISL